MIGLVYVASDPEHARRVAGLTLPHRSLLALQSAGVTESGFTGPFADAWRTALSQDDRWKSAPTVHRIVPDAPHVVVADDLVIDNVTARALVAREGVLFVGRRVVAVHRSRSVDGDPLCDGGEGTFATGAVGQRGVAMLVADDAGAAAAEVTLLQGLRKSQDGMVARALNRPVSLWLTRRLCRTGLRPNVLSVGILGIGLVGAALAARGSWIDMALGAVLFQTQSVLDGCDGELSRLTFRGSRLGEWLDTVGDDLTNYTFFAGLSVGLARTGMGTLPAILGTVGVTAGVLTSVIAYRYLARIGSGDLLKYPMSFASDADASKTISRTDRWLAAARPFFKRDFFVFATLLAVIAGRWSSLAMLAAFAVGACMTLGAVLHSEWLRRDETFP